MSTNIQWTNETWNPIRARVAAIGEAMEATTGRPVSGDPADDSYDALPWPLPNVWLGVSVEDQAAADNRVPELLATPAAVRFLSCEPLLSVLQTVRFATPEEAADALCSLRASLGVREFPAAVPG